MIANPASMAADVKYAKRSLLRTLTNARRSSLGCMSAATPLPFSGKSNERSARRTNEKPLMKIALSRREEML